MGQAHRYAHCVRVARLAERLAYRHGQSTSKARVAGVLHDLARLYSNEKLLADSAARGVPIDAYARAHPVVLHAPLSAALARADFGIDDEAVLSAISKHTLGHAAMSPLDCILYLADGLEPGRTFGERESLVDLAFLDLQGAMRATLRATFGFLREKGLEPAPQSLEAARTFGIDAASGEVLTGRST